jgi:hypothetical protein
VSPPFRNSLFLDPDFAQSGAQPSGNNPQRAFLMEPNLLHIRKNAVQCYPAGLISQTPDAAQGNPGLGGGGPRVLQLGLRLQF